MPLPRDRYPDLLTSETLLKLDRHRIDEARRVACEQYTRANRLERERDIARDALNEYYSMWAKAEREKREIEKQLETMSLRQEESSNSALYFMNKRNELEEKNAELVEACKTTRKSPWEHDEIEQLKAEKRELVEACRELMDAPDNSDVSVAWGKIGNALAKVE